MQLVKIPLEELLSILTDLYEDGVDYVDISGTPSTDEEYPQDIMHISIQPEYMCEDMDDDDEEEENTPKINVSKFSDEDIDNLI